MKILVFAEGKQHFPFPSPVPPSAKGAGKEEKRVMEAAGVSTVEFARSNFFFHAHTHHLLLLMHCSFPGHTLIFPKAAEICTCSCDAAQPTWLLSPVSNLDVFLWVFLIKMSSAFSPGSRSRALLPGHCWEITSINNCCLSHDEALTSLLLLEPCRPWELLLKSAGHKDKRILFF